MISVCWIIRLLFCLKALYFSDNWGRPYESELESLWVSGFNSCSIPMKTCFFSSLTGLREWTDSISTLLCSGLNYCPYIFKKENKRYSERKQKESYRMFPPLYTIIPEIFSSMHLALLHVNCTPICLAFFSLWHYFPNDMCLLYHTCFYGCILINLQSQTGKKWKRPRHMWLSNKYRHTNFVREQVLKMNVNDNIQLSSHFCWWIFIRRCIFPSLRDRAASTLHRGRLHAWYLGDLSLASDQIICIISQRKLQVETLPTLIVVLIV